MACIGFGIIFVEDFPNPLTDMETITTKTQQPIPYEGSVFELISKLKELSRQLLLGKIDQKTYEQERTKLTEGIHVRTL